MSVATDTARVGSLGGSIGKKTILAVATLLVVVVSGDGGSVCDRDCGIESLCSGDRTVALRGAHRVLRSAPGRGRTGPGSHRLQNMTAVCRPGPAPLLCTTPQRPRCVEPESGTDHRQPDQRAQPRNGPMWSNLNQAQITANPNQVTPGLRRGPWRLSPIGQVPLNNQYRTHWPGASRRRGRVKRPLRSRAAYRHPTRSTPCMMSGPSTVDEVARPPSAVSASRNRSV